MRATRKTLPRSPIATPPIAIVAGETTNLKIIPTIVLLTPHAMIFCRNAMKSPAFCSNSKLQNLI